MSRPSSSLLPLLLSSSVTRCSSSSPTLLLTIQRINTLFDKNLLSSVDINRFCYNLAVLGEDIWGLNAFAKIRSYDDIMNDAEQSDIRRSTRGRITFHQHNSYFLNYLDGIPISIKSNIAVANEEITAGSRILQQQLSSSSSPVSINYNPNNNCNNNNNHIGYDADIVNILVRKCNSILIGINTMDEFGMGSLGTNVNVTTSSGTKNDDNDADKTNARTTTTTTTTCNPRPYMNALHNKYVSSTFDNMNNDDINDEQLANIIRHATYDELLSLHEEAKDELLLSSMEKQNAHQNHQEYHTLPIYSSGGSSCGSATSVTHGSSIYSIGSDTGGSIRLPSCYTGGCVGMKPSYGLISRHGLISYASSLDTIGILSKSTSCSKTILYNYLFHNTSSHNNNQEITTTTTTVSNGSISVSSDSTSLLPTAQSSSTYLTLQSSLLKSLLEDLTDDSHYDNDSSSVGTGATNDIPVQTATSSLLTTKLDLEGITIGIPEAFIVNEINDEIYKTWKYLCIDVLKQKCGATIKIIPSSFTSSSSNSSRSSCNNTDEEDKNIISSSVVQNSLASYYILASAEASSNLLKYDGLRYGYNQNINKNHTEMVDQSMDLATLTTPLDYQYITNRTIGFGNEVKRRLLCGTYVLSSDRYHSHYEMAGKIRATLTKQFNNILKKPKEEIVNDNNKSATSNSDNEDHNMCDALVIPTSILFSPCINKNNLCKSDNNKVDNTEMFANDIMTVPISLAGLPSISVPIGITRTATKKMMMPKENKRPRAKTTTEEDMESFTSFQVVSSRFNEQMMYRIAKIIEKSAG